MTYTMKEVLQFVNENDVKFIRLAFCDLFGAQKNISIMPQELERAFSEGIGFDGGAIKGFTGEDKSDLFLVPDPSTLCVLPWRPQQGRVARFFCDVKKPGGEAFEKDARNILRKAQNRALSMGYTCQIGAECEFYLFEADDKGNPTTVPFDQGGYFDIAPADKGENVRREICLNLEQMGIRPESSHHEQGPGQNEIDFRYNDALAAADDFTTFKSAVKTIAARNGLYASFMPKPLSAKSGSGMHVNLSLAKNGFNIFKNAPDEHSHIAESFVAGVLSRCYEISAFTNPTANSYARLGACEAPKAVCWSHQNRSALIRIPASGGASARMEVRSPDPSCNPYLVFALLVNAGLDGVEQGLSLPAPVDGNLFTAPKERLAGLTLLPGDLGEALKAAKNSEFVKGVLGRALCETYIAHKQEELAAYWEMEPKRRDLELYFPAL